MAEKRKARKKGQHRNSPNHSDLFTNENPEGDIKGLGFKDAATAKKGVSIVNKAKRDHAHKVQATLVMVQRGKEVIKRTKDPEKKKDLRAANKIWSAHLEKLKKKTKEMNESVLRSYVREILSENKLRVFDFDDTLAVTDSMIILTKASGEQIKQTPGEWAVYKPEPGDEFDYSEFGGELMNPREIKDYMNILRRVLGAGTDGRKAVILTARAEVARQGITNFLEDIGLNVGDIEIVTLGESDPQFKARWIEDKINDGYDDVYFVDDSDKNIRAVQALATKYPDIKLRTQLV